MSSVSQTGLPSLCPNCGEVASNAFCSVCGQRHRGRLAIGWLWREMLERTFNGEQGIVRTFVDMAVRPGKAVRDYLDGRRRRYVNPLSYYFIAAAAQLLALLVSGERLAEALRAGITEEAAASLRAAGVDDPYTWVPERYEFLIQNAYTWLGLITLVLPMSLVLWILLRRSVNFAESLVFCLFILSHIILITALLNPLTTQISLALHSSISVLLYFVYAVWGAMVCFGRRVGVGLAGLLAIAVGYASFFFTLTSGFRLLTDPSFL
ncbi:MAG: DUF3667 domain-containing protein [Pseudomonadota bacterium]